MKSINLSFVLVLFASAILSLAGVMAYKGGFDGSWKLDITESDFGNLPKERAAPVIINIFQNKGSVTFDRKFQNVPTIPIETLSLGGKQTVVKQDEFTVIRTMNLSEDKLTLTVNSKYLMTPEDQEPWEYTRTETYALAKDGKSLFLARISTLPDGKQEIVKAFYNKVK